MKTTSFERSTVRLINSEIESALQSISIKYGLRIEIGSSRFSATEITTKVKVAVVSESGTVLSKEAKVWDIMAPTNGITLKVGDRFKVRSSSLIFTVKGWNTRSPKFPIQAEAGGKSYKLGVSTVKFSEKV
jgi:hypothetical protein